MHLFDALIMSLGAIVSNKLRSVLTLVGLVAGVASIIAVMKDNTEKAQRLVDRLAKNFPREHHACPIGSDRALDVAIITSPEARDRAIVQKLDAVAGRVLG